jgi:flagellar biosynthesis protein FlhF
MKIVRQIAPDMRQALRAVREQLGADAVILSSRRTSGGVEITAAIDFDAEQLEATEPARPIPDADRSGFEALAASAGAAPAAQTAAAPVSDATSEELRALRRMLETQLAHLAWNDLTRRTPVHTELLRELTEIGLSQDLAARTVAQLPSTADLAQARRFAISAFAQQVVVTGDRWLENGGRIALVGPTGVGKTTLIAKLAVRWVLRHGPRDLTLISADSVRIGAAEQMRALGRLLGAPVFAIDDMQELPEALARVAGKRLVLVDTPGSSQRDAQLAERLAALAAAGPQLETALVLAASTQAGAIEETVRRFAPANVTSCLLTKLDEAASLGGLLSVAVKERLPLAYVSEGQRVPEDLRPARALELVSHAFQLARTTGAAADEDLLARRFGEVAHALA